MRFLMFLASAGVVSASATYSLAVFAPDTKVDGESLNAAGQSFYTGTSGPATYCPSDNAYECPEVQGTLVTRGLNSMAVSSTSLILLIDTSCFFTAYDFVFQG